MSLAATSRTPGFTRPRTSTLGGAHRLSHVLHYVMARSLWECDLATCLVNTTPFRPDEQAGQGSNPLRMNVVARSELFPKHERWETETFLFELTVVQPCIPKNVDTEAKRPGAVI